MWEEVIFHKTALRLIYGNYQVGINTMPEQGIGVECQNMKHISFFYGGENSFVLADDNLYEATILGRNLVHLLIVFFLQFPKKGFSNVNMGKMPEFSGFLTRRISFSSQINTDITFNLRA